MEHAQIDRNHLLIPNRVRGFELDGDGLCSVDRNLGPMFGSGDAVGDINDVYCLNKAIKEKKLLRPETWATALTPSPINSYGMGCGVTEWHGKRRINHSGGHKGFRTLHVQLPEEDFDIISCQTAASATRETRSPRRFTLRSSVRTKTWASKST